MQLPSCFRFSAIAIVCTGLLAAFACSPAAYAQINIGVTIGTPPPPQRYEVRPAYPGDGYLWQAGYWEPSDGRYRWQPGFWASRPYADGYYVRPFYAHDNDGYRLQPGHWEHRGHAYGHRDDDREDNYGYRAHDKGDKEHHDNGKHGDKEHHGKSKHEGGEHV